MFASTVGVLHLIKERSKERFYEDDVVMEINPFIFRSSSKTKTTKASIKETFSLSRMLERSTTQGGGDADCQL